MTEDSRQMSAAIRRASGRDVREEEEEELIETLRAVSEDLAVVKEAAATTLEMLQEIRSLTAGEREEPGASEEAAS